MFLNSNFYKLFYVFFCTFTLYAQSIANENYSIMDNVFWTETENIKKLIVDNFDSGKKDVMYVPYQNTKSETFHELLKEVRYIISAIIYGYEFEYRPPYKDLNIKEFYSLKLRSLIPLKSKGLEVIEDWSEHKKYYIRVRYKLNANEIRNYRLWQTSEIQLVQSRGVYSISVGRAGKILSIENGIKNSILKFLKMKLSIRPSLVRGYVTLIKNPKTFIKNGKYEGIVETKIKLEEVDKYIN